MRLIKHFTSFSMFGVKFITESSRKFLIFESVRRNLILLLINFMDENAYLHVYVVSERHTYNQSRRHGRLFPSKQSTKPPKLNYETL